MNINLPDNHPTAPDVFLVAEEVESELNALLQLLIHLNSLQVIHFHQQNKFSEQIGYELLLLDFCELRELLVCPGL